ncbi:Uncharacterized conserved protein YjgD, DUF1641 family [Granulicella rosea]|uniref:Uncharacterized conserved protein YjgD, DUF1641 family n=1 Tax=Granulicella rosea TaxID=474952 RepID=A0A239JUT4_9BACT|nr:DUF1641 domain-containing protein [Granulicella rosea]SNT09469.1 Uncharacterized conserved protein YjgD, DUF1641 family [Granulicella rosea]
MANPIPFKPAPVDPKHELNRRLNAAPTEHAEALLVAYDLLQSAHDQGLLDLVNGMVGKKDFIAEKIAFYAKQPEGIAAIRNLLNAVKLLTQLDPETLEHLTRAVESAAAEHKAEQKPPSLWQIAKRATSEDSRRAMSFMTLVLGHIGKALKA